MIMILNDRGDYDLHSRGTLPRLPTKYERERALRKERAFYRNLAILALLLSGLAVLIGVMVLR